MKRITRYLIISIALIIQWTWGIVQNLVGLILFIFLKKNSYRFFHASLVVNYKDIVINKKIGCFTLGMFIFINEINNEETYHKLLTHEYGHTIQSLIFGPFYLPLVGYLSVKWSNRYWSKRKQFNQDGIYYTSKFPENQANFFGEKILNMDAVDW